MLNQILNNRYHITALLGEGAMGEVYRATDTQTGQEVAVKVITKKLAFDEEMLARFRREGEALRQLRHSNIVAFVDMFAVGKQQAIVMEYVPGGSLHSLIKHGPLPIDRALRIALELCDALTRAHLLNIIHRDIKPENVLMAEDGTPKLTDFGVARLVSETTRLTGAGTQMGTPYYMSPEAWEGQELGEQADIWSLGIMLFEMVTGQVPFAGNTLVAVMNKVLTTQPPDLKSLRPDVPPALVKIIQRTLTRDLATRYQFMREVALDLERVARGGGTDEETVGATVKEPKTKAGGALPTWAMVALVVGLLVVGGLGLWAIVSRSSASVKTPTLTQPLSFTATAFAPTATLRLAEPTTAQPIATSHPTELATALPTPTEIPASVATAVKNTGAVLFEEHFDSGKANGFRNVTGLWRVVQDETGNWVYDVNNKDSWSSAPFGSTEWKDYSIEYRVRLIESGSSRHFGVNFRCTNDSLGKCYELCQHPDGSLFYLRLSDRVAQVYSPLTGTQYPVKPATWYHIRIDVEGTQIRVFVNDIEQLEVNDSSLASGSLALNVEAGLHVQFDDVKVTEILPTPTNTPAPSATETPSSSIATGTMTATSTTSGTILYEENFESGKADGWIKYNDGNWTIFQMNGSTVFGVQDQTNNVQDVFLERSASWRDYAVETDAMFESGQLEQLYLIARTSGDQNPCTGYTFGGNRYGISIVRLDQRTTCQSKTLAELSNYPLVPHRLYRVRLEVEGTKIRAYIDGELVLSAEDSVYPIGGVSLSAYEVKWAYFDNIRAVLLSSSAANQESNATPSMATEKSTVPPATVPPTLAQPTQTWTPVAAEPINWAITFDYRLPVSSWSAGTHQYTLTSKCPNAADGSVTQSFTVLDKFALMPGDIYLRWAGLRKSKVYAAEAVEGINPSQSTVAVVTWDQITKSEAIWTAANCTGTVTWDGGAPQPLIAQTPFQH